MLRIRSVSLWLFLIGGLAMAACGQVIPFMSFCSNQACSMPIPGVPKTVPKYCLRNRPNLTNSRAAEGWPVWHPDGTHIIYSSDPTGNFCLYEMSADDSGVKQITHVKGPWYDARASISPDGKNIAFNRQLDQSIALVTMPMPEPVKGKN